MTKLSEYEATCSRKTWCDPWSCDSSGERSGGCKYMPSCIHYSAGYIEISCNDCDWFDLCENKRKYQSMLEELLKFLEDNYNHMNQELKKKYKEFTWFVEEDWYIDKQDEKPHDWDIWYSTISDAMKENGGKIHPYEFVCDYGSYDDAYEIGRVIEYGIQHADFAWTKDGHLYIHGYPPEDKKQTKIDNHNI